MITAFFAFVTFGLFTSIAAQVVESIANLRSFS